MSIGQRIKRLRKEQGLSIDDLAYRLGKNRTTVYRYENGDIENLPLGILDPLASALNTTPAHLMGWDTTVEVEYSGYEVTNNVAWINEFGADMFNDEEYQKIIEYAKFLLSIREN